VSGSEDSVILDHAFLRTATPEQVVNYCDKRIDELVEMIKNRPAPPSGDAEKWSQMTPAQLNEAQEKASAHLSWRNRFLIQHGRSVEALVAAQAWGHISVEQFQALKTKLDAAINWKLADAVMGGL
jgi:hypothetical protein